MTKSIADLLKQINLKNDIPDDHPVLTIPLSVFTTSERADLIAILWLFSEGYCQTSIDLNNKYCLDVSHARQIESIYNALKIEIKSHVNDFEELSLNSPEPKTLQFSTVPFKSLSKIDISQWLSDNKVYQTLVRCIQCDKELALLQKWSKTGLLTQEECKELSCELSLLDQEKQSFSKHTSFAYAIADSAWFRQNPRPLAFTLECLISMIQLRDADHTTDSQRQIILYFINALTSLQAVLPVTFEAMIISYGIEIPHDLDKDLIPLLQKNIHEIDSLKIISKENMFILAYFMILFITGIAKFDPQLIAYRCLDDDLVTKISKLSMDNAAKLQNSDAMFGRSAKEIYQQQFDSICLKNANPNFITILCLQSNNYLAELFMLFAQLPVPYSKQPCIPIAYSANPYLIGDKVLHIKSNVDGNLCTLLPVDIDDYRVIENMLRKWFMYVEAAEEIHKKPKDFVELRARMTQHESSFFSLINRVKDSSLKKYLAFNAIGRFVYCSVIDYPAVIELVRQYKLEANNGVPIPSLALEKLLKLFGNFIVINTLVEKLAKQKIYIDLDRTDTLKDQIDRLTNIIQQLNLKLNNRKESMFFRPCFLTDDNLTNSWYRFERHLCMKFLLMLKTKQKELDAAKISAVETDCLKSNLIMN